MANKSTWEIITEEEQQGMRRETARLKIVGGWLYRTSTAFISSMGVVGTATEAIAFVPAKVSLPKTSKASKGDSQEA